MPWNGYRLSFMPLSCNCVWYRSRRFFRPFPRLVRDMAQSLQKKVVLAIVGETTEADKTIIDRLFEPLMHLVRNALDHGLEDPQQRKASGKSETATITMRASHAGRRFMVDVTDDGRGIDPSTVKRKALERGLLAADKLAALSDEQALDLIFSAGFSTAARVSDISGRGVGMDVVRTTFSRWTAAYRLRAALAWAPLSGSIFQPILQRLA
jgi:two-component system chemotaxis sensor kinase CheA